MSGPAGRLWFAAWLWTAVLPAQEVARVEPLRVDADLRLVDAAQADFDGDGRADLVLALQREGRAYDRLLRIHLARAGTPRYRAAPDAELPLPVDAVGFALGDVHAAAGDEVVVLGARGAVCWRPLASAREAFSKLVDVDLLWQVADPRGVVLWQQGVVDLNGDGRADLLLPEPGGYAVALQRRDGGRAVFGPVRHLRLPAVAAAPAGEDGGGVRASAGHGSLSLSLSLGGESPSEPLVDSEDRVPVPWPADWDGDGDLDLLAMTERSLLVWRDDGGGFAVRPGPVLPLPVAQDRQRSFDVARAAHVADLDGDHRVDCVLLAGDYREDDVRTQVLVFEQGEDGLFGPRGVPSQLLVLGGFGGGSQLRDLDGDGAADLVVGAVRLDVLESLSAKAADVVEAELYVYRNDRGHFSRRPDVTVPLRISTKSLERAGRRLSARFIGDVTGDGTRDLLLRSAPERLQVRPVLARGGRLRVPERPLWELTVDGQARLRVVERAGRPPVLLVLEPSQVLDVRFR